MYNAGEELEDPHEKGKRVLKSIADLGASRAGKLVGEIQNNLWRLNQEGADNEYLKYHLAALFAEFITGEDYDLPYYDEPEVEPDVLDSAIQKVLIADKTHGPCSGCSVCWDKARQDLVVPKEKDKPKKKKIKGWILWWRVRDWENEDSRDNRVLTAICVAVGMILIGAIVFAARL